MITRREFLATSGALVAAGPDALLPRAKPVATLGVLTDVHYADADTRGSRHYRASIGKVQEAADLFQERQVDRILELGDLIDAIPDSTTEIELGFLRTINDVLKTSGRPRGYVLGNHCLGAMAKPDFLGAVGQENSYTSFNHGNWTVVVLDACFRKDGIAYDSNNFDWTDTFIHPDELDWLQQTLRKANDHVLVTVHQRIDQDPSSPHAVANAATVRQILADSGKVRAVYQGHAHVNEYFRYQKTAYLTLMSVVDGPTQADNSYSVSELYEDGTIKMKGYRRHPNREFTS